MYWRTLVRGIPLSTVDYIRVLLQRRLPPVLNYGRFKYAPGLGYTVADLQLPPSHTAESHCASHHTPKFWQSATVLS
jgi:hypothetical protein